MLLLTTLALAAGRATASSTLTDPEDKKVKYTADKAVDGQFKSGWGEGEDGYGEGAWLELDFGKTREVSEINIWPGNLTQGKKSFREYSRPKKVLVTLSGGGDETQVELVFLDKIQRFDSKLETPVKARKMRIEIIEVYEGFVFSDCFIAEAGINFHDSRDEIQRLIDWLDTPTAIKQGDAHDEKVKTAFSAINAAEFGDQDQLEWIMDQAGDGAEYIRKKVPSVVDVGFRAAAIRPDAMAMDALQKLKDANSIPAIEMAQLRSTGRRSAEMQELVEIFYAYQQLVGGPSLNVPFWGETGWTLGQIQSFGEPTPIEATPEGELYIADIGNNRVQMFNYDGNAKRQWGGGEPDITNVWYETGRTWYVSGAAPGDRNNEFTNPLDVELIPLDDDMTGFAVLDASKRVQIFDGEGRPLIGWPVQAGAQLDSGVGGEGYLAWVPGKELLYVVLGDELIAYTMAAEEVGRWELEDGTPNGLEVGKNKKLYFVYGREVVKYDLDGFRHGVIWDTDVLGEGFEDMDITIDEDGKLWVVTDQGWVFKMKNERKVEYKVQFSDVSLIHPRIAVQDDILYCVDRDRIIRLDALQAKLDDEEEAARLAEEVGE
jgi:hypothetical protein